MGNIIVQVIAAGGGGAAVSYFIFRFLGKSWLDQHFSKKLQELQHNQNKELARLSIEIDTALSGTIKFQEKEFDFLSETWNLMLFAESAVMGFVNPFQSYEDVARMSSELREEFIEDLDILDSQKREILASSDPAEKYQEIIFLKRKNEAMQHQGEFQNYYQKNSIFMNKDDYDNFKEISDHMRNAVISHASFDPKRFDKSDNSYDVMNNTVGPKIEEMRSRIRDKFAKFSQ